MRTTTGRYEIDDDPARVDIAAAADFLTTEAYWGGWRGAADIERQLAAAWRVVGAYDQDGTMVGLARAASDGGVAYLADVYVLKAHRGAGLGKAIVRAMVADAPDGPAGPGQRRWMLHTNDAHGLYRQFGFTRPDATYLERPRAGPPAVSTAAALETGVLAGRHVRLEPLSHRHVPGLLAAAAGGEELYRWTPVPQDEAGFRRSVETALAARDNGTAVPYAVTRIADGTVIGTTRFWQLDYWNWPPGHPAAARGWPDAGEIGHTWLGRDAIRTAANTETKRLMLTHAFEVWQVQSICLHTDARNERSRDAVSRLGAHFDGVLPAHRLGADLTPRNSARFSITAADWPQVRQRLAELTRRYP